MENKNKNIFNNYLIDVSHHTHVLYFQKMVCRHDIPVPISIPVFVSVLPSKTIKYFIYKLVNYTVVLLGPHYLLQFC